MVSVVLFFSHVFLYYVHKYDIMFGESAVFFFKLLTIICVCLYFMFCVKHSFFLDPNWIQSLYGVWCLSCHWRWWDNSDKNCRSYRIISLTNFNAQFSLFINNMFVTLLSSTCFEDNSVTYILLMNKENCALKLVNEIIL